LKNKSFTGFAFFILVLLFILLITIHNDKETNSKEDKQQVRNNLQSLQQMSILENNMEKEKHNSTNTKKADYKKLFPDLYTVYSEPKEMQKNRKVVYLTFDDGPSEYTFKILDILNNNDIKATFFIVGSSINEEGEDCLKRMVHEGHTIGVHSYSHLCNEIYCSIEHLLEDFNRVYQQIYDITGKRINIYRFPLGSLNGYNKEIKDAMIAEMERRGFSCYDWNVDTEDSTGRPTVKSIKKNILRNLDKQDQPIILLHDSLINDVTVSSLPSIIKMLKDKGYEFDTLDNREPYVFP
jgi:peptidoglycan-N-acetylglucosamine deacetylase